MRQTQKLLLVELNKHSRFGIVSFRTENLRSSAKQGVLRFTTQKLASVG